MRWVLSATPRPFYLRKRIGTHRTGGWVGHRVGLDECGKSRLQRRSIPRAVQPVASRYSDYAIVVTQIYINLSYVSCYLYKKRKVVHTAK